MGESEVVVAEGMVAATEGEWWLEVWYPKIEGAELFFGQIRSDRYSSKREQSIQGIDVGMTISVRLEFRISFHTDSLK